MIPGWVGVAIVCLLCVFVIVLFFSIGKPNSRILNKEFTLPNINFPQKRYPLEYKIITNTLQEKSQRADEYTLSAMGNSEDYFEKFVSDTLTKAEGNPQAFVKANPNLKFLYSYTEMDSEMGEKNIYSQNPHTPLAFVYEFQQKTLVFFFNTNYLSKFLLRDRFRVHSGIANADVVDVYREIAQRLWWYHLKDICQNASRKEREILLIGWSLAGTIAMFSFENITIFSQENELLSELSVSGTTLGSPRCLEQERCELIKKINNQITRQHQHLRREMTNFENQGCDPIPVMFAHKHLVAVNSFILSRC